MKPALSLPSLRQALPWMLIIGGSIGLVCSFILVVDHIRLLENPNTHLGCDLNPIISCGSVIKSSASTMLGAPNPVFGLPAFTALITMGVLLQSGVVLRRWIWLGLQLGASLGMLIVGWLFYDSVYIINRLCPYCMAVWAVVITTFWYVSLYNIEQGYLRLPAKLQPASRFARRHHGDILLAIFLIITALILQHFWYYYGKIL